MQFDALNMRTSRDIKCKGLVLNLGDTPQKWSITATVVVETGGGQMHHKFQFQTGWEMQSCKPERGCGR